MKISVYLLCFLSFFLVSTISLRAIGKRKSERSTDPHVTIQRIVNNTDKEIILEFIYADKEQLIQAHILPQKSYLMNQVIPLSKSHYDLIRFYFALPLNEEPVEKYFLGITRVINKIDLHHKQIKVSFDLGTFAVVLPQDSIRLLQRANGMYDLLEHTVDNYGVDIFFSENHGVLDPDVQIRPYSTPE